MEFHYGATTHDPYLDLYSGKEIRTEYNELGTVPGVGDFSTSAVVFDKTEELFWTGNQGGHVTSYYGPTMQKYTSFPVHANEEVRALLTLDAGLFTLTKTTLRHHIRRGLPKFTHRSEHMLDMQCLLGMDETRIIMGGHQNKLIDLDLVTLKETKQHSLGSQDARCAILRKHSYLLVAGDPSGRITLRDPSSLRSQHVLDTHSASLSDVDVQGNLIATCGFSNHEGTLSCDNVVFVYDVRALRPLSPTPLYLDPLLLRFLPSISSRLAVLSAHGQVQLINLMNPESDTLTLFQVNVHDSHCTSFDISATSQAFGFGDSGGNLHLFSAEQNTEPLFNLFSRATEFADEPEELPFVSYDDRSFKISSIKMPPLTSGEKLLSYWPDKLKSQGPRPIRLIDAEVLRTMKMKGNIGYAPNPGTFLRNQVNFELPASPKHSKIVEKSSTALGCNESDSNTFVAIPKRYRKLEVRYSKLGNNDFDFEHHNKTGLPGLEATLPNSYCNAMLQVLYYTLPVKRALLKHTCSKEFCLSCELGFLFRMLDTSPGTPCQAANFLRAFRTVPEASALGLILSDRNPEARMKINLGSLIQSWNRFILHQMHYEILDTRKKETHPNSEDHKVDPFQDAVNKLTNMSLTTTAASETYYNDGQMEQYDETFYYEESDFPVISSTGQETDSLCKKRQSEEEKDKISLMMNEGKYMWLSPSALAAECDEPYVNYTQDSSLFVESQEDATYLDGDSANVVDYNSYGGAGDSVSTEGDAEIVKDGCAETEECAETDECTEKPSVEETAKKPSTNETEISRLFGTKKLQVHRCLKCTREEQKESIVLLCNLSYPPQSPVEPAGFTDILRNSLCPRKTTPAWCEGCHKFTPTLQSCTVKQLPQLLAVNCGLATKQEKEYWQKQMDYIISGPDGNIGALTSPVYSNKPCRYGQNCSKPHCKFKHPDDPPNRVPPELSSTPPKQHTSKETSSSSSSNSNPSSNSQLYAQHPWLPLHMVAKLESLTSKLTIARTDATEKEESVSKLNGGVLPRMNGIVTTNNEASTEEHNHCDEKDEQQESLNTNNTSNTSGTSTGVATRNYSLSAVVCHIEDQHKNIVALVKMGNDTCGENDVVQWYVFNDFSVTPVPTTEVNWFNLDWKTPCVLFYESESCRSSPSDSSILNGSSIKDVGKQHIMSSTNSNGDIGNHKSCYSGLLTAPLTGAFTPLASHEMPKAGELVGMDAEFVTLNQGEAELRSDGRLNTLKPSHLAVARITCVRGQGPLECTPFIDDYISTQEQVVDYLTKFSGIKPGDLDANFSSKHLTTLKSTYQKLRCLVDSGVIFVGHGLKNDFRVINLVVSPQQVIDTVQLFHLPNQRMVSLKFLAWHLLDTKIQSDTHDSIEDARTALQLYRRYIDLENKGLVSATLSKLYETGKKLQWKVPVD